MREAEEVLPLLALQAAASIKRDMAYAKPATASQQPAPSYQRTGYVSYALKPERRQLSAMYGTMPATPDQHSSNQSETESDSDGSCTASSSTGGSLQSILRIPSCRGSLKKHASVEFSLDIDSDEDEDTKRRLDGSCAARCMPRRLTIEEKAALYRVRPDLELVPTVLLLSELEELRRRRQRKLLFSLLGASLILLMMIVFYYLVSQM
ncbi:TRM112 protein [Phytophthora cinnamomi]|uniref:TRM112 protein n=1 Tax=Phytophthora cinnamomi TaxID=4785 RepID=UPI00355AAF6C|nr:TRM112 protein [Phytophthora cinnamomi]